MPLAFSCAFSNICSGGGHADLIIRVGPRSRTLPGLHTDEFRGPISDEELAAFSKVLIRLMVMQLADKSPAHVRAVIAGKIVDLTVTD